MKIKKQRTREEVAALRQAAYLDKWPLHKQFEADQDRINGRPEKFNRMMADFAQIREELPYPESP